MCVCVVSSCMMSSCVMSTCVMSICVMSICVMSSCVMSTCVMSSCVMSSCVTSIFVMSICVVSICVMSSCVMSICVISICVMSSCVMSICVMWSCVMPICVISICVMSTCVMSICVMWSCVTSIFVMSICALSSYVMSVCVCVMSICVVSICVMSSCVMSICVISICVMSTCVMSICVMWSCVTSIFVMSICAMSSYVMSVCVCVCDVKLCDVNLCDFNLCDVNLCDVNLCDVKLCDVNLCDVNLCDVKLCDASVRVCDVNLCGVNLCDVKLCDVNLCDFNLCDVNLCDVNLCDVNLCNANLCAQLPQTQFTHSKAPNPHASKTSTQNFRTSYWHSYPKRNLHTARRQTRMPARHPHKIFAPPISTATPNAIYTQQAAKPACQEDIDAKFSQLLLAQLPRTQFTHSAPPNPHASRISTQNFRSSYWHSYPERNLHTASRQTRMPGRHRRKVFAPPIGTATPNAIYTQQAAKPACQEDINTQKQRQSGRARNAPKRTSDPVQVLQVPRLPRKSSGRAAEPKTRQSVHQTPCKCSKSHACHAKAAAERRSPKRAKAYIRPRASAPSATPATQKQRQSGGDQNAPKRTSDPVQVQQVPRLPRKSSGRAAETKTRQSVRTSDPVQVLQVPRQPRKSSGRAAETKTRQSVHQTPRKCSKSHACHAQAAAERRRPKHAKAYIRPRASAPSAAPATQKQRQSGGDQNAPKRTSQTPRLPRKSSGRAAETKTRQSVHQTPRKCSKCHACYAKQRQSGGDQNAPKRTSDPVQVQQAPRLPRKSSGRAAETKTRQSVHQTPCKCSKRHACHAKAAAERRRPKRAKAYIRPRASAPSATPATQKQRQSGGDQNAPKRTSDPAQVLQVPRLPRKSSAKAYIRPRASAPSATPATQKQRQSGGDQNAPKRTSDPVQVLQAPRLPRKSSGRAAETKTRQSVHQTPCKCSKPHACHAKATAERRRPKHAKAYIRPRAGAASPTPATQKQRQSGGDQNAPKRTSDPAQVLQVPRLPRKSSGRAAETKTRQSVHQTPCKCSKSHACHAKAAAEQQRPKRAKAYIRPRASAPSATPAAQKQRQSGGDQNAPKRTSDPVQVLQVPRLPRKSSGRAAEPKTRQSVHQTPLKCRKPHTCHAKRSGKGSAKLCDVKLCDVKLCDVKQCDVKLCDVKLCDVKLCDVKLCDVELRDVNPRDVKLRDVKQCDVKLYDACMCGFVCVYLLNRSKTSLFHGFHFETWFSQWFVCFDMLLDFTSQLCFVLANRRIRTSFPVASFSTSWTHLTKSNFYQVQFAGDPIFYQAPLAGGHGVQSGTMSNEATWLYGKQSLISSVYLLREETVELQILLNRCSLFFTMSLTPRIWIRALTIAQFELTSEIRIFGQPLFRISHDSSCCSAFQVFSSFSVLQFCSLANFSCVFDCTFLWVESTLTSIQDDGRLLYTTDVKYLDLPLPFSLSFCFARFKVLSEQMLLLNLSKCVFCNRSPTRWLQPLKEEHLYGDASTTFWLDYRIYTLNANSST